MMLPSFAKVTATILDAPLVDDHGTKVRDWSATLAETPVSGCSWQPSGGSDDLTNRDGVQQAATLFMPAGTAIDARHRIRVAGKTYAIVGEPERWELGLSTDHVAVRLERWDG